jgi:RimJ/RimL family protein N-acetyltransferase
MLVGTQVVLRAWRETDLDFLVTLRNDAALQAQLLTQPRPSSLTRVRDWLIRKSAQDDCVFFVVATVDQERALGYVQATHLTLLHRTGEFGICLGRSEQRMGYGTDAFKLLESYLQTTFGCRKLVAHVLASNAGALAFHHRCGFADVGLLRSHFYLSSDYHDVAIMERHFAP